MNDLHTLVAPIGIAAGADGDERSAIIALLSLQLMNVTELGRRLETLGDAEFPFKTLPFVPVAIEMQPVTVGLCLHLVTLTIAGDSATVIVDRLAGMSHEIIHILTDGLIIYHLTVDAIVMVFG